MKVLLDHNVPAQLRRLLKGHLVLTTAAMQWFRLENGDLVSAAEAAEFEILVTGDKNLSYQQNNQKRSIALVVISETKRNIVLPHFELIGAAISRATLGSYELVHLPKEGTGIRAVE